MLKYLIGIDCGLNTGFAVYNKATKKFRELDTYTFWQTIHRLNHYFDGCKNGEMVVEVFIEDVTQNKPTFFKGQHNEKVYRKISQDVGSNKRDCILLMEYCDINHIKVHPIRPTKKSITKISQEQFTKYTGYTVRSSSHSRDAAMLVWGR